MTISALHKLFTASAGICTDTRTIQPQQLFFAIKGDNFDGNKYAKAALENGATYAVVEDVTLEGTPNTILVKNVLKTLQDLANFHRKQFNIPVIGITGSNGKTTSKELINSVLSQKYETLCTKGNLNNHLGVPFTLLEMTKKHQIAIVEMGANKPGDIKELVEIAEPTHGVITNIGKAHIEGFGGLEGVISTKTEMFTNISDSKGCLFVNQADPIISKQSFGKAEVISYGQGSGNVVGRVVTANPTINFKWKTNTYKSPILETHLIGSYNLNNFLLAICIGDYFHVSAEAINQAITNYKPTNNRSQVTKTAKNTLIVDCYNANPSSMESAIESFKAINAIDKLMVLGDMLELGHISEEEHKNIISLAKKEGLEVVFVGHIFDGLSPNQPHFKTVEDLLKSSKLNSVSGKTILLKGSRGIKLEKLIEVL